MVKLALYGNAVKLGESPVTSPYGSTSCASRTTTSQGKRPASVPLYIRATPFATGSKVRIAGSLTLGL